MSTVRGRCLCGDLAFSGELPSLWVAHCHCTQCQRGSGAAFVTWVGLDAAHARIDDPNDRLRWFASSPGAERGFCTRCGSAPLFRSARWPGELHVTLANLVDPVDRAPQAHVFWETHVAWVQLDAGDGLPRKPSPEVD